jgi:hypothetical protein
MDQNQRLAEQFEEQRPRLRSVAYRILGSSNEADDAVQEAWLRLSRSGPDEIGNLARLHDMFDLPFEEIAVMVRRTPAAARQLASRAGRRVKDSAVPRDRDTARQREVVNAFFAAARSGDFDALVAVLDPDVVLRIDADVPSSMAFRVAQGAEAVADQALARDGAGPARRGAAARARAGSDRDDRRPARAAHHGDELHGG